MIQPQWTTKKLRRDGRLVRRNSLCVDWTLPPVAHWTYIHANYWESRNNIAKHVCMDQYWGLMEK